MIKDLKELIENNIISQETADHIQDYYDTKKTPDSHSGLLAVFGVIGSILIGLGIILIVAHNWDQMDKSIKTTLAFIPLLIGQGACFYTIQNKFENAAWRNGSSAFLFFSIAAVIALMSQIYNIEGSLPAFMLTWLLLALPIVYIMRSSLLAIFYVMGIIYLSGLRNDEQIWSWVLLFGVVPFYYYLIRKKPYANSLNFMHWLLPIGMLWATRFFWPDDSMFTFFTYLALLGLFIQMGKSHFFEDKKLRVNGYLFLGTLGTLLILFISSFHWFWEELFESPKQNEFNSMSFIGMWLFISCTLAMMAFKHYKKKALQLDLINTAFLLGSILALSSFILDAPLIPTVIINIYLLVIAIMNIKKGIDEMNLPFLNMGMIILAILIICRFFDTDISFVLRGVIFLLMGIGFILTNVWIIKKSKEL